MDMSTQDRIAALPRKPWLYYIVLIADIAKWSDERGLAEIILNLAYGMADVMHDEAVTMRRAV